MKHREDVKPFPIPSVMMERPPVDYAEVTRSILSRFSEALRAAETRRSEKPMQEFLEANPAVLVSFFSPHTVWVLPRQSLGKALGGGWQPDFLVCDWNSNGPEWTIVELESPTAQVINTRGISQKCREAQQQVSDYRRHMKDNWKDLQLSGFPGARHQARSRVVIGRRKDYAAKDRDRLIDLRNDDIEVASYDRLYDQLCQMVKFRVSSRAAAKGAIASWAGREIRK